MSFGRPNRIEVKYDAKTVQDMLHLLEVAPFPNRAPIDASEPWKLGVDYDYLVKLKTMFLKGWNWESLERKIAKFENYLVHYEHEGDSLDLHYVHVKSARADAIPLILLHGWPGTFFDFHKVIEPLTNPGSPDLPAFHVVVPSIPGYFLSTLPRRDGWSLSDDARLYNGLMTKVLGYEKYTAQGGDWGTAILRFMGCMYPESVQLMHFDMFRAKANPGADPSTLSETEKRLMNRMQEFAATGMGYFQIQQTKPFTIGIAIASSPLAMLTYIGEKIYAWSDPERVDPQDIIDTVALYYLSGSFATSVMIYNQSQSERAEESKILNSDAPFFKNKFGVSAFPYELGGCPRQDMAKLGPLVFYKEHANGGHFPALDSPNDYISDLREFFGQHWRSV